MAVSPTTGWAPHNGAVGNMTCACAAGNQFADASLLGADGN